MLFSHLLKKMAPIYPETDELWRAENWPKLVPPLSPHYMLVAVILPPSLPVFKSIE